MFGINDAVARLKSQGLHVTARNATTWAIAASAIEARDGISVSNDATFLLDEGQNWRAVFPGRGQCTFEVPGTIGDLVNLIISVYRDHRNNGGPLWEAFARVVPDPDPFVCGEENTNARLKAKSA